MRLTDADELDESAVHVHESDSDGKQAAVKESGAGDGIRTRDPLVGNQMLYQAELLPRALDCKSVRELELAPAELSRGLAAMTIGATNIAFLNLFKDYPPRSLVNDP
jgi:hypothetical protein